LAFQLVVLWPRFQLCKLASEECVIRRLLLFAAIVTLLCLTSVPTIASPVSQKSAAKTAAKSSNAASKSQGPPATITVDNVKDIDPTKASGSKNAPVVMEVFADFQCPACKMLYRTTLQRVMDNYVNSGKIYLVDRDFPLAMHAYSMVAALYSRAAAHIGKGEEVEQALFENQEKWEVNGDVKGTVAAVLTPSEMKKVDSLVESGTLQPLIDKDKQIGQSVPVTQTPTAVIHTKDGQTYPIIGYVSYDVLKTLLNQLVK
jgi:protein-disulfide isomerase